MCLGTGERETRALFGVDCLTGGVMMSAMTEKASLGFFYGFHALEIAALAVGVIGILTLIVW